MLIIVVCIIVAIIKIEQNNKQKSGIKTKISSFITNIEPKPVPKLIPKNSDSFLSIILNKIINVNPKTISIEVQIYILIEDPINKFIVDIIIPIDNVTIVDKIK